jgi:hypothetical protein
LQHPARPHAYPPAGFVIERIGDLVKNDLAAFLGATKADHTR